MRPISQISEIDLETISYNSRNAASRSHYARSCKDVYLNSCLYGGVDSDAAAGQ